jgi:DNA gyrase subunit A
MKAYIDNPNITLDELTGHIPGPDFPTGGIIFGAKGIRDAYETGRGKVLTRGRFEVESGKSGRELIVFTEIPYGVNKAALLERIAGLSREKVVDGIAAVNDESDREGLRIVIELKRGAIHKVVVNQLFSHTALQSSFNIINLALVHGRPRCLSLKELITHFIEHRVAVVTRRVRHDLTKAEERAHILEGLVIALGHIDEVVALMKGAKDTDAAKAAQKARFSLSDAQAQAVMDMRLARLTGLETEKLKADLADLAVQIAYFSALLQDRGKLLSVIREEIDEIARRYGDSRRTEIVESEAEQINVEDLIKKEEMMILISNLGYLKRVPVASYRNQGRGGKGMISAKLAEDDFIEQVFVASTHEYIMFITSAGKAYWMKVYEVPEGSRTSKGAHIKSVLPVSPQEEITAVVSLKEFSESRYLFMGTAKGIVKKVKTGDFANARTRGIFAITLDEGDSLVSALLTGGGDEVMLISRQGLALRTGEEQVRSTGRMSRGIRGIRLADDDALLGLLRVDDRETMLLLSRHGYGKRVAFDDFNAHGRATYGQKIYQGSEKTGDLAGCVGVLEDDEIMCITSHGKSIKLKANTIRVMGKGALGVRVVSLTPSDAVIGVDRIVPEDPLQPPAVL